MPRVEVHDAAELPERWKLQVLSFLRINFTDGFVGANLYRNWISGVDNTRHVVIVEGDMLIAHTEVKWKWLEHAGERFKVFGLSGVLTYPAFRKQGYGAWVIREGTSLIRVSDADLGVLGCDPELEGFYAAAGWEPMRESRVLVGDPSGPTPDEGRLMMLFLSEKGMRGRQKFIDLPIYWGEDELW